MKLVRYGNPGKEKPGLIDADGKLRDLSGVVPDIGPAQLGAAGLARIRKANPAKLPLVRGTPRFGCPVGSVGKFIAIGLNYADHAAESGVPIPKEPVVFMKATSCIQGPNDPVMLPRGLDQDRLGSRARRRDRHPRPLCVEEGRADSCRRLLPDQRRQRARVPARARPAVGQGQGLRHLRPDRPLAGHDRRDRERAAPGHVAGRERPAHADRQHPHHDLRRGQAGELRQPLHDAAARRRHHHRHAARRRAWA